MNDAPGEFELIRRIRRHLVVGGPDVVVPPGDDCAAVRVAPGRLLLLTCDVLVEGRHFRRDWTTPRLLGRKLAAVNLSDVAAMGGTPRHALVSLVVPPGDATAWVEEIARGVSDELGEHGAVVIGGNLSGTDGLIVADLTLVGDVREDAVLRRTGACPGDVVLVTGTLGDSAAGLAVLGAGLQDLAEFEPLIEAQRRPTPRVAEGIALAETGLVHAAIDISDGLASDLGHLCAESNVGADVELERLPIRPETAAAAAATGDDPTRLAVSGGEDYELLVTAPPESVDALAACVGDTGLTRIGKITKGEPVSRFLDRDGRRFEPGASGWDHFL